MKECRRFLTIGKEWTENKRGDKCEFFNEIHACDLWMWGDSMAHDVFSLRRKSVNRFIDMNCSGKKIE